jgi:hypothetical protein
MKDITPETATTGPTPRKARRKRGPNGIAHWQGTRDLEKATTRAAIEAAISRTDGFPTRARVLKEGSGTFSPSSIDRHIDLLDQAQAAFNRRTVDAGGKAQATRKGRERTARQDRLLDEERARSADLASQVATLERAVAGRDERIAHLEERVRRLELSERERRRERRTPLKASLARGDVPE